MGILMMLLKIMSGWNDMPWDCSTLPPTVPIGQEMTIGCPMNQLAGGSLWNPMHVLGLLPILFCVSEY
jgi:hypothetical protein